MDSGWATFTLSHWHRDSGVYSLPEAVRRLTRAPARILGLEDRGTLAAGLKADVNVIDLENLAERQPEFVHDFPGGAGRYVQRGRGYRATLCNGQVIAENDELTGARRDGAAPLGAGDRVRSDRDPSCEREFTYSTPHRAPLELQREAVRAPDPCTA